MEMEKKKKNLLFFCFFFYYYYGSLVEILFFILKEEIKKKQQKKMETVRAQQQQMRMRTPDVKITNYDPEIGEEESSSSSSSLLSLSSLGTLDTDLGVFGRVSGFVKRRIYEPAKAVFLQGISPEALAKSFALGINY